VKASDGMGGRKKKREKAMNNEILFPKKKVTHT